MQADKILKLVRLSEKSNKLSSELGQYTFEVYGHANKHQIAQAVEETFKVTVRRVNTQTYRGKNKKSRQGRPSVGSDYKTAIVTLSGDSGRRERGRRHRARAAPGTGRRRLAPLRTHRSPGCRVRR